ncbi:hypothetical protein BTO06_16350 [Tenacibaculum sp. SZ-18]|uniref:tyrosine-type recombinase/integrase n=1 Tax=Tenacibaculum sp. SZ-18 TaxID=754423 RepID=UPI000C2CF6FE|nr:tyrosine-type recombinase/integrase [Tenacibaculum sp. SZ-18]AUC14275.1 hypothetical protein BTO06_03565 [Tenacibaculum sp. SZ-18]AUC14280.1 hypothetical protein BTO06_03595 [Tenacibaculum sp. SZ-18]AUC16621.1 hypothetical protein BTO06_16350 [Tenacibaculum sp. SZ-18]
MNFRKYLEDNKYSKSTITVHLLRVKRYTDWLEWYGKHSVEIQYNELLQYVKYLQEKKQYQRASINNELRAVKLYYDYLIEEKHTMYNPAENIVIRGKYIKVIKETLTEEELEDLYYSYNIDHHDTFFKATKLRDKVVLGLMLFQGLTAIEIYSLQEYHLQLQKGIIEIPRTRRSNPRTHKLQPLQMLTILEYINTTRNYLTNRIQTSNNEQLIYGSSHQINAITGRIIKKLKRYNNKVTSYSQLRSSIIINWLQHYNLRKVQYLAGHRYISSTEKYVQDNLEKLHDIVNTYHPIN